jgi:uncharacterized membrane protein YraQ (UPF0718 family)
MRFRLSQNKTLALLGCLLVIPSEWFLFFGFTFSLTGRESLWTGAFILFAFLLNIPAVLLSWFSLRLSAYWMLANMAVSMTIGAGFQLRNYLESPLGTENPTSNLLSLFAGSIGEIVLLWFAPGVFALGALIVIHSEQLESRALESARLKP